MKFSRVTEDHLENKNKKKSLSRKKRSKRLHLDPSYEKVVKYMIKEGKGYCGYYAKNFGYKKGVTDLEIDGRQPWVSEVDFSEF